MSAYPRTVQEIHENVSRRKDALRKALTDDVEKFFMECHPEKDNLCLYGDPDGSWTVDLPAEEVPAELPEPCLGINFARDGMARKEWLALVAVHSDAWLMSVAFYYGAKLNGEQRRQLFTQLNNTPTLFELVTGKADHGVGSKRARSNSAVCDHALNVLKATKTMQSHTDCVQILCPVLPTRCSAVP